MRLVERADPVEHLQPLSHTLLSVMERHLTSYLG
jgi:hypothetical protein